SGAARTASAGGYLLLNASPMGISTSSATASRAGSASSSASATSNPSVAAGTAQYRLDADESKLSPHVGPKVEVTGTLEQSATASSSSVAGSSTSTAAMSSPRIKVDSVRMVSSTCP